MYLQALKETKKNLHSTLVPLIHSLKKLYSHSEKDLHSTLVPLIHGSFNVGNDNCGDIYILL